MNAMKAADPSAGDSELSNHGLSDLEKVQAFIQEADQNQNNSIDYREFIAAQARRQLFQNPKKQDKNFNMIVQSFNFFDVNDDGVITKDEIAQLLKIDNNDLSEEVLEYMIQQVDTDNDGTVCFEEFVRMMKVWEKDGHIGQGKSRELLESRSKDRRRPAYMTDQQMINQQSSEESQLAPINN